MDRKQGSVAERMGAAAEAAATLIEQHIALLQGFEAPRDAAGVERSARALGAVLICARRTHDLDAAVARRRAAAPAAPGPEEDDPDDEEFTDLDPEEIRAELKRRHAGWDAERDAGRRDRRLDAERWDARPAPHALAAAEASEAA